MNEDTAATIASLRGSLQRVKTERDRATNALEAAIEGKRRFFGAVLMAPEKKDDWSGAIWLQDPIKRSAGFGLRFESLAAVRVAHPELWPVSSSADGILMDAAKL